MGISKQSIWASTLFCRIYRTKLWISLPTSLETPRDRRLIDYDRHSSNGRWVQEKAGQTLGPKQRGSGEAEPSPELPWLPGGRGRGLRTALCSGAFTANKTQVKIFSSTECDKPPHWPDCHSLKDGSPTRRAWRKSPAESQRAAEGEWTCLVPAQLGNFSSGTFQSGLCHRWM